MRSPGKSVTKTRFTSLILKCPSGRAAIFSHQHPAWHVVLESVDAEIEMVYLTNSQI